MAARAKKLLNIHDKMETIGMRTSLRFLLVAALLVAAIPASAQVPVSGISAQPGCGGLMDNDAENAELIAVKVTAATGLCTDILFDLSQTGGTSIGGATTGDAVNVQWLCPPNWTNGQIGSDAHFALLIYPPAAGSQANRMMIDSGAISNQDFTAAAVQTVGNSIPSSYTGTQGIDLVLSSAGAYSVKLRGPAGATSAGFPRGANGGVEVAFAPLAEVNTVDLIGGGCTVAGETRNPAAPNGAGDVDGVILGYNVYRLSGTAGAPPTANAFYTASLNADPTDGWQYFMPLTQSHGLGAMDTNPGGAGTPSPSDTNPNDLSGLQNVDGVMYSGDEVMIFQDSATNRGVARSAGSAPVVGTGYWYAFQPVMCGDVAYYSVARGFGPGNSLANGDHGSSLSALGAGDDSVDLDLDGNIEFFSPQADVGAQPGLGLTYNGIPVLSQPVFGQMDPLAAGGGLTLSGTLNGTNVNITFQTGLEAGNVQGFNVYRGVADARVRVNEQLILVQGTESSVYQLVDDAVQARRLSKGGSVQYTVEIVYADGTTSEVGPFSVTLDRQAPGRRSR